MLGDEKIVTLKLNKQPKPIFHAFVTNPSIFQKQKPALKNKSYGASTDNKIWFQRDTTDWSNPMMRTQKLKCAGGEVSCSQIKQISKY